MALSLACLATGCASSQFYVQGPVSQDGFDSLYIQAALERPETVTLAYPKSGFTEEDVRALARDSYGPFYGAYPEYASYTRPTGFSVIEKDGNFLLTLEFADREGCDGAWLKESMDAAESVYRELVDSGCLGLDAPDRERAEAMLRWVCENMSYRYDGAQSTTPWCGFVNRYGTCGSYTGMYNLLLRWDGIECRGRYGYKDNIAHVWTVAVLDGEALNIDATWCDGDDIAWDYFAKTDDEFRETHRWS